jgi:hypothetical protein
MEQRYSTAKRNSNLKQLSVAEQLFELRELRKLVREAETISRTEEAQPGLAGQG